MSKSYTTMVAEVGTFVMDTSADLATIIGTFVNEKYQEISRRCRWSELIDWDYTISVTSATAEYAFPTLFDQEIFCADITNGRVLTRYEEGTWWAERATAYSGGSIPSGDPSRYLVLREASKIRFDPAPVSSITVAFPYKKKISDLSGSTEPTISDIDNIIIAGAIGEAFAYKKNFGKAGYYMQKYEAKLSERIYEERSRYNQIYQRISNMYRSPEFRPLTGWLSYDSI